MERNFGGGILVENWIPKAIDPERKDLLKKGHFVRTISRCPGGMVSGKRWNARGAVTLTLEKRADSWTGSEKKTINLRERLARPKLWRKVQ